MAPEQQPPPESPHETDSWRGLLHDLASFAAWLIVLWALIYFAARSLIP